MYRMALRISMWHVDTYDDRTAAFARQLGLRSAQLHTSSNLAGAPGYWTTAELRALRERCEAVGLALEGLETCRSRTSARSSAASRAGTSRSTTT